MKTIVILFAGFLFVAGSCSKGKGPLVIPESLFFVIKQNGQRLPDTTLNNMKLYYFNSGSKTYINDFIRAINEGNLNAYDLGIQVTRQVGHVSADDKIKDFYLEFQGGDIDTLYIEYRYVGDNEAFNNSCYCHYPMGVVKYNGAIASQDPTITVQRVFRFDKP